MSPGSKKTFFYLVIIIALAALTRLPFISYPDSVVFDEGLYATFASHTANGHLLFDIHPPLARLLFAAITGASPGGEKTFYSVGTPFDEFPYVRVRLFIALLGICLPLLIFFIVRELSGDIHAAFFASALIIFDNALVLYSRLMLPDMILFVAGLTGIFLLLYRKRCIRYRRATLILAGIFFGLAASVKWTGLGFFLAATFLLLPERRKIVLLSTILLVTYGSVFTFFLAQFPPGRIDPYRYQSDFLKHTELPSDTIRDIVVFLPYYHALMFKTNLDVPRHVHESSPYEWPLGDGVVSFWGPGNPKIILVGNLAGWALVSIIVMGSAIFLVVRRAILVQREERFLLFAFLSNYAPLFFISRSLFLYHYLPALMFGYMLVALMGRRYIAAFVPGRYQTSAMYITLALIIFLFVVMLPITYGVSL